MWVSRLLLTTFRNHTETDITLTPGVTVFVGNNGQGKTNLVEALGYLATGGSHRVSSDDVIVMNGHDDAIMAATAHAGDRSVDVSMQVKASGANKAFVNNTPSSLSDAVAWVTVVFFSPEDLAIIRSDPSHRRRFLDIAVVSGTPRLQAVLSEYDKVLRQRNMLLKSAKSQSASANVDSTLAVWNEALIRLATDITIARKKFLNTLEPFFHKAYNEIRPGHDVSLAMQYSHEAVAEASADMDPEAIAAGYTTALAAVSSQEKDRATTLIGPHRDDMLITLNGLPTRTHSSQGEAWSTALSLKLGLARYYQETSSFGDPVIILDDVFAELDDTRRQALALAVGEWEQVLITAAVPADIPETLGGRFFTVAKGRVIDE